MIKHNEILFKCELNANRYKIIDLKYILPLGKIDYVGNIKVELSYDNKNYFNVDVKDSFNDETARYIKITSDVDKTVSVVSNPDDMSAYSGVITIPETVSYTYGTFSVTSIASSAFSYCF